MAFYQILDEIMEEQGLNIPAVSRKCGLSDGTIRSIMTRKQEGVALGVAFKISDGLGVSLERLNGMPDPEPQTKKSPPITDEDKDLLDKYHKLDVFDRGRVIERIDTLLESDKYKEVAG